jgi:hypothetical protein
MHPTPLGQIGLLYGLTYNHSLAAASPAAAAIRRRRGEPEPGG